jgi:hypothetical protein
MIVQHEFLNALSEMHHLKLALAAIVVLIPLPVMAQSALPPCPADSDVVWTNCLGTFVDDDGVSFVGSWKNDHLYGPGSMTSAMGHLIVDGIWLSDSTVKTPSGDWHLATSTKGATFFVLTNSIRKDETFRRAWLMMAYNQPTEESGTLSVRSMYKFDCANEREKTSSVTTFSGSFGSGNVISQLPDTEWNYVAPGTAIEAVMKYVCGHKLSPSR